MALDLKLGISTQAPAVMRLENFAVLRKALGNEHPNVALAINNLALVLGEAGRYDEASRWLARPSRLTARYWAMSTAPSPPT